MFYSTLVGVFVDPSSDRGGIHLGEECNESIFSERIGGCVWSWPIERECNKHEKK
jgi:hypothetical protein